MAAATLPFPSIMIRNSSGFSMNNGPNSSNNPGSRSTSVSSASTNASNGVANDLTDSPSPTSSDSTCSPRTMAARHGSLTPVAQTRPGGLQDLSEMDLLEPKIEYLSDEEMDMRLQPFSPLDTVHEDSITGAKGGIVSNSTSTKRGRGRPRKHPLPQPGTLTKVTKGRSKTGCITCRRRKKKCDETRPECMNCVKNSVVCEGYPEKTIWQSGKQKSEGTAETALQIRKTAMSRVTELPCLIDGVETPDDRYLLDHFVHRVSKILTVFNDDTNPFQEYLMPLAVQHRGLMHSLLCLSGSHIVNTKPEYMDAQMRHYGSALAYLSKDDAISRISSSSSVDKSVAQMLLLCLNSICLGESRGEYRLHLNAARDVFSTGTFETSTDFHRFLYEFFMFHEVINCLTTLDRRPNIFLHTFNPTLPDLMLPKPGAMLGVLDGLFTYISRISILRDTIRDRRSKGLHPVDYQTLSEAVQIDAELHSWQPPLAYAPNTNRFIAALLYRQCTWIYLYRTILESRPSAKITGAVEEGLKYLKLLPPDQGTESVLLTPTFILGCAAFQKDQRPKIERRFEKIKEYSGLKNIDVAQAVVRKVWDLMDLGDEGRSWDWEGIISDMGYDFLAT